MKILNEDEECNLADLTLAWERFKPALKRIREEHDTQLYIKKEHGTFTYIKLETEHYDENISYYLKDMEDWLFRILPEYLKEKEKEK